MRWADIDGSWWTIPKAKNGRSHRVFLSRQAMRILEGLDPETDYVFPARRGNARHLETPYKARDRIAAAAGVEHWTIHDLRRTAATMMASIGVSPFVIEKILGHADRRGITAIYDRSSYDAEKRDAMIRWGRRVQPLRVCRAPLGWLSPPSRPCRCSFAGRALWRRRVSNPSKPKVTVGATADFFGAGSAGDPLRTLQAQRRSPVPSTAP
jgi:hypothetical protein